MGEAHSRPSPARIHYRWSDGYVLGKRVSGKGYQRHSSTLVATVAGFGWHVGTSQYLWFARSIQKLLIFKLSIRVMVKLLTGTVLSGTRVCSPRLCRLIDNSSIGDAEPDLTARRSIPIYFYFCFLSVCLLFNAQSQFLYFLLQDSENFQTWSLGGPARPVLVAGESAIRRQ